MSSSLWYPSCGILLHFLHPQLLDSICGSMAANTTMNSLAAVNFFLFTVGATQTARILNYRKSQKSDTVGDEVKDAAKDAKNQVEGMAEDPKGAVRKAENV